MEEHIKMSSNLNWMDNKVVSPGSNMGSSYNSNANSNTGSNANTSRQPSRTAYTPPADSMVSRSLPELETPRSDRSARSDAATLRSDMGARGADLMPSGMASIQQGPPPSSERGYIPYYLTQNIGNVIRAEFIIGNSQYTDRVGRLVEVGFNYFVLDDLSFNQLVMCDLYSVKFVTILRG